MKTTLGLDVSPLRIGWALLDNTDPTHHGTIHFDKDSWVTPGHRADALEDAIGNHKVDQLGAEAVFVGPNRLGSIRAAMALGQIESICDYLWPDAPQKILTATQWRSLCEIKQGGKQPVMEWATKFCEDSDVDLPDTQDAADAIAIAFGALRWFANNDRTLV